MELQVKDTPSGIRTREKVRTKLTRITQRARKDKEAKFCALGHLMYKSTLREAFRRLSRTAALGIDGETKESYEENLAENIDNLYKSLKNNSL
ncbi:hypothetical protein [Acetohalobium arabaticum]|uniref:RNA-directed DNA polymerase (Reverse transcriptase) n=1 Tax=Acetohalobium arabaticum (strain ATCC 49924 / DSM 5501 / Z-7288) TaxID=574087 RepID=D9QPR3_ACEAZ|nr:hypothetical protein [Acetohalobium arabaticum]ADL12504.1 hypothetical protein Acear_0975 [Acetohalobium arabaticum DSM 5501]